MHLGPALLRKISDVNRELWLILSLFAITGILNFLLTSHAVVLSLYSVPTIFSAYLYGRRHASLTAVASVLVVAIVAYFNPALFGGAGTGLITGPWLQLAAWGGVLIVMAYTMGSLYERSEARWRELRETYYGILLILQRFISKDKYTENHCYRVSVYATTIASHLGLSQEGIEDVRAAALLHDIGKLDVSKDVLYKAAKLTDEEYDEVRGHVRKGVALLEPVGGSLRRVLPIVLAHHDRMDGSGYHPTTGADIPIEARILAVADAFDAITSDRPYRKGSSAWEAKEIIERQAGTSFDTNVVKAFATALQRQELEIPEVLV